MADTPEPTACDEPPASATTPMTLDQAAAHIRSHTSDVVGEANVWEFTVDGVRMAFVGDVNADRMRIVAPIARTADLDPALWVRMMEANFHTALDARYSTSDGTVFATFIHPLSPLSIPELEAAMSQVALLARTFGTTFSSTDLVFGGETG